MTIPVFLRFSLDRVAAEQSTNKMTEYNLATVFAPTLVATPPQQLTDLSREIHMLSMMIKFSKTVF